MERILLEFITIAGIHLLAVMSPGPDFAMILRNSFVYSRKTAVYTALGLGLGIMVHVAYSLVGLGLIISRSIILFNVIKILGALYLLYIGYMSIRAKPQVTSEESSIAAEETAQDIGKWKAIRLGFLTNILNPKATLFFLSIFSLAISPSTPMFIKILYGIEMSLATFMWFAGIAFFLSQNRIRVKFKKIQHWIERVMGGLLVALGIKILLSSRN